MAVRSRRGGETFKVETVGKGKGNGGDTRRGQESSRKIASLPSLEKLSDFDVTQHTLDETYSDLRQTDFILFTSPLQERR